ncbi:MAG: argininosuccinate lyase [Oligoflexia bacterium]|nr:argininosuccinate lyase [Oligoflexia bacterium]
MKLWDKGVELDKLIEDYTVGSDYIIDDKLVKYDCIASKAHAKMLNETGILDQDELNSLVAELDNIILLHSRGLFHINKSDEDCHTAIENHLVEKLGETGKKIHTARSRNDQVLTAIRLYEKDELSELKELSGTFIKALESVINKYGNIDLPGYTHMQRAMPSGVSLLMGAFVESARDNILLIDSVFDLIDQSPLGTAAGFGVPVLNIDREMTADLMGFDRVQANPLYAQLSRGKFEATVVHLCSQIMYDINKLATDLVMFSMSEFGFVSLPENFCTGSSIMPQKKNPDVLELARAKYHVVLGEELKIKSLTANLISGYNRDLQLTKEPLFTAIETTKQSLKIMSFVLDGIIFNKDKCILSDELFATEKAYKLVDEGMPFRDAYKKISRREPQ